MMKLNNGNAGLFIPDGMEENEALKRITHLGIGAHQDDLEFMAFHGILACYDNPKLWFGGVTCTNGSGSARTGEFASFTDEEMQVVRRKEQNTAAEIGQYAAMFQLDYPSRDIKDPSGGKLESDLIAILEATRPEVVYTHNLADKHDSHIAVVAATIRAMRSLPAVSRPRRVLGCEVWRGLDWMMDNEKVALDVGGNLALAEQLNSVFASQIAGGKRYDLATIGRRRANATFFDSHSVDQSDEVWYAMELTPLIENVSLDPVAYVRGYIDRFAVDVQAKLQKQFTL